jgi:holliday junction DNA helicase RuvA
VIAHLRGTLADKGVDHIVVDVGGVGFEVNISLQTLEALPPAGEPVTLLTHLAVREDALTLFGFATADERAAFELCTSVQGIGPKLAMAILSSLAPAELARAVRSGDHARLVRIPGIGKKTAERLVLELRDKIERAGLGAQVAGARPRSPTEKAGVPAQVASALANLGYRAQDAERAAQMACDEAAPETPVAELVKRALRALAEP